MLGKRSQENTGGRRTQESKGSRINVKKTEMTITSERARKVKKKGKFIRDRLNQDDQFKN